MSVEVCIMESTQIGDLTLYTITVGASTYIVSSKGARLLNWFVSMADGSSRDVIYMPANVDIAAADFASLHCGMPVLFPFAGASFVDGKEGFWKTPSGEVLPMRKHGYAIDGDFEISEIGDASLKAVYKPSDEFRAAYPFDCEFCITYRFSELSFTCELTLKNNSAASIPWGAGLHPYFNLPWSSGLSRSDYRMVCDAKKAYHIQKDGSFVPADIFKTSFADEDMQNRIITKFKNTQVKFGPKNGEEDITVKIGFDDSPNVGATFVTWSESPDAPYYCVEPWMNMPNCASKPVHTVDAGKSGAFVVEISLL